MSDTPIDIRRVAALARLRLTPEEETEYAAQLEAVIGYVAKLEKLDVTGVEPASDANAVTDVIRDDTPRPGLSREAALSNAPVASDDQFLVPRVIES